MTSSRKKIPAVCKECGQDFMAVLSYVKKGHGIFCSRKCQRGHQAKINAAAMKGVLTRKEMIDRWRNSVPKIVHVAHDAVAVALANGSLKKQPCEVCGAVKVDGHHDDYTKPLDVRWLCRSHHLQHHRSNPGHHH